MDQLLEKYGYVRDGDVYRVEKANRDTIALFCHAGLQHVLLSYLLNVPLEILKQHLFILPSSIYGRGCKRNCRVPGANHK